MYSPELIISSLPPFASFGEELDVFDYAKAQLGSFGRISEDVWNVLQALSTSERLCIESDMLIEFESRVR